MPLKVVNSSGFRVYPTRLEGVCLSRNRKLGNQAPVLILVSVTVTYDISMNDRIKNGSFWLSFPALFLECFGLHIALLEVLFLLLVSV